MDVPRFIVNKYKSELGGFSFSFRNEKEKEKRYKDIYEDLKVKKGIDKEYNTIGMTLQINEAFSNYQIYRTILELGESRIEILEKSLFILEKLEEKHKNKKTIKDLFIKNKLKI
ncbi:hypothetical protein COE58_24310 [Bacillus cereus]|nr:hypothetical protein COE58_24310 [Bacillus cereus]